MIKNLTNYNHILKRIDKVKKDIWEQMNEQKKLREVQGVSISDMPRGSETSDPTSERAIMIDLISNKLLKYRTELKALEESRDKVIAFLDSLDPKQRQIITLRLIDSYRWSSVSLKCNLSRSQCHRIYNEIISTILKDAT